VQKSYPAILRFEQWLSSTLNACERARVTFVVILFCFCLLVWGPTLFFGIDPTNSDDHYHTTDAALHHTPQDILRWFTQGYDAYNHKEYRPLTRLSLLGTYLVFGRRLFWYHLTNVLLNFLVAWLLAAIMVRARAPVWGARLAALLFMVSSYNLMAVRWINGRQDLLCAALILAAVWLFLGWLNGRPWWQLVGAALAALLAALAKEPGAMTPFFVLLCALLVPGTRSRLARFGSVVLVAVVLAPYVYLRLHSCPMTAYEASYAAQIRPFGHSMLVLGRLLFAPALFDLYYLWLPMGVGVILASNFLPLLLDQIFFWGGLDLLLRHHPRQLLLGLSWKVLFVIPVYNLYWNTSFTHYRYLPNIGTMWLSGLVAWEMARWASARLRSRVRIAWRFALIGGAYLIVLVVMYSQLQLSWPSWSIIRAGGPRAPATFGRQQVYFGPGPETIEKEAAPARKPAP
jgi:hypothetical protein